MDGKTIGDLVAAEHLSDSDLFEIETTGGSNSVPFSKIKEAVEVEFGSNEHGYFLKYPSGYLKCWSSGSSPLDINMPYEGWYFSEQDIPLTFPHPFTEIPLIQPMLTNPAPSVTAALYEESLSGFKLYLTSLTSMPENIWSMNYVAEGRWK